MDGVNPSGQQRHNGDGQLSLPVVDADGIGRARHLLADQLAAWGLTDIDGALLVFSELATNAVIHAGHVVAAEVSRDGYRVRIDVEDQGPGMVALRDPGPVPGGLGLRIVSRLSEQWGTEPTPTGKVVWAVVACGVDPDDRGSEQVAGGSIEATRAPPEGTPEGDPMDADRPHPMGRLLGTWATSSTHPATGSLRVNGSVEVSWLEGGHFLLHRTRTEHPDFPDALWVMGQMSRTQSPVANTDDANGSLSAHYFDSRGVFRVYGMAVDDDAWRLWREEPGFSQRFTGSFADRGDTITGQWQLSRDGTTWDDDLQITYTRRP